jgi:hypothetical protein
MWWFKQKHPGRFAVWAFIDLFILFSVLAVYRPVVGITGLGAVLVLSSILVEANKELIWEQYKEAYKKAPKQWGGLNEPKQIYYNLNVYVIWPVMFLLGLLAIAAAFLAS